MKANGHSTEAPAASPPAPAAECGKAPAEDPLQPGTDEYKLHLPVTEVLDADKGTKDEWIPR
jgi:hypothetical protein